MPIVVRYSRPRGTDEPRLSNALGFGDGMGEQIGSGVPEASRKWYIGLRVLSYSSHSMSVGSSSFGVDTSRRSCSAGGVVVRLSCWPVGNSLRMHHVSPSRRRTTELH